MKRLLIALVMLIVCFSATAVFADGIKVTVDEKTAEAGETVEINISMEENSGIIAAMLDVHYDDTRLELTEVQDMRILDGGTFSPTYKSNPYRMLWNSASDTDFTGSGAVAVMVFRVREDAQPGKAPVTLSYSENNIYNVNLDNVPVSTTDGGVIIPDRKGESDDSGDDTSDNTSDNKSDNTGADTQVTVPSGGNLTAGRPSGTTSKASGVITKKDNPEKQIILTIDKKEAVVFGVTKVNDVAPVIRNERTMLPARFVSENLGAAVSWDEGKREVTVKKDETVIIITIDSQTALVNGRAIVLESPAFIENDRTYTPLRFITEKLGARVEWNGEKREVVITKM